MVGVKVGILSPQAELKDKIEINDELLKKLSDNTKKNFESEEIKNSENKPLKKISKKQK